MLCIDARGALFVTVFASVFDVSDNQLGGTLPTALTAITGSNFVGNCFPGYPPLGRCDGYYMGAAGDSCTTTCTNAGNGMTCRPDIVTNDASFLLDSLLSPLGVTCTHTNSFKYGLASASRLSVTLDVVNANSSLVSLSF